MSWLREAPEGIGARGLMKGRLGVLSGTFNPPTRAHLALAAAAVRRVRLEEVLFVLPEQPPHKQELAATFAERAEMLRLAVTAESRFSAATVGPGLFLDIHRAVAPHYPTDVRMFFLAGRDAGERILLRWPYDDPRAALRAMFQRFDVVIASRGGPFAVEGHPALAPYAGKIHRLDLGTEYEKISATRARECLAAGRAAGRFLAAEVEAFIRARGLYGSHSQ